MTRTRAKMLTAVALFVTGTVTGAQPGDTKAAEVVALARKALGGEQKLQAVRSLSLRGSFRREAAVPGGGGGNRTIVMMGGPGPSAGGLPESTGDLEIDVEFPDKYIRVETGTGGPMAMTRTEGFEGERPFLDISSSQPGVRIVASRPADDPDSRKTALQRANEDLARLLLGMIAGTQPSFAVTFGYAGQAESPEGRADVIDVKGPENFAARLFLDSQSHLPLMLTYVAPEPRLVMRTATGDGPGRPPAHAAPPSSEGPAGRRRLQDLSPAERERLEGAMKEAESAPAKMVEHRVFFGDYRDVGGLSLPHRISRGTAEKTTEEWEIKGYRINPSFKADRFKVGS
jgi:hypothetical protein